MAPPKACSTFAWNSLSGGGPSRWTSQVPSIIGAFFTAAS
jgi:hypothetical protein